MRIGGFVKQSFIDWEGMLSAVIFIRGCNMRCGYCHNPSLVLPGLMDRRPDIPENEIFEYLDTRRSWLDGVVVTGGEPTLHIDLPDFIARIKGMGYKVKLDTNGTNPLMLKALVRCGMIDFVAMDIKHIPDTIHYRRITPLSEDMMMNINSSVEFLQSGNVQCQFRTTVVPGIHTSEVCATLKEKFSGYDYVIQRFRRTGVDGVIGDYVT